MILSIMEAAKRFGISRSNLYALRDKGKISFIKKPDGKLAIDLSELHRVFPQKTSIVNTTLTNEDNVKTAISEREMYLEQKAAFLEKQLALEQERVTSLLDLSKNYSEQLLLTHRQNNFKKSTFWQKLFMRSTE